MSRLPTLWLIVVAMLVAACSPSNENNARSSSTGSPSTSPDVPAIWDREPADDQLVLFVNAETGPVPQATVAGRPLLFAVYADGTLLAPSDERSDRMVAPIERFVLDADERTAIDGLVHQIGLPSLRRFRDDSLVGSLFDAGGIAVTYVDSDGVEHVYSAYGLEKDGAGQAPQEDGWPSPATYALGELTSMFYRTGFEEVGEPYRPDRLTVYWFTSLAGARHTLVSPWPLRYEPEDFGLAPGGDRKCVTLRGSALDESLEALEGMPRETFVEVGDKTLWLVARPLMPGEPSCGPEFDSFDS